MNSDPLKELGNYLRSTGGKPLPPSDIPEEKAPDLPTATSASSAIEMAQLELPPSPDQSPLFRFFVDGVQRTVPVAEVVANNVRVPIHLAHLVAGAMERAGDQLRPSVCQEALVLIFPYQALQVADSTWSTLRPPGAELGSAGGIYSIQKGRAFYSDSSISLETDPRTNRPRILLQAGELIQTGKVRLEALSRSKVLLRIMEIGIVWELRQQYPDSWILLDGPVAPPLKYARLVDPRLQGLQDVARPDLAFDFLSRVVGAVKRVLIIPDGGLEFALSQGPNFTVPIYRFGDFIEEDDAVAKEVLCAFLWLRRELANEISAVWSTVSGLARFDIPLPTLLDSSLRDSWNALTEEDLFARLSHPSNRERQELERIVRAILVERWPVPSSTPTRMLTELFPIEETERWLSAQLRSVFEMRSLL